MSDKKCCVPGCAENKGSHKTLHGFPNPVTNMERFRTWVYAVGGDILKMKNVYIYKYRRVCHAHFEERFCCRFNKISNIATPTLHMPGFSAHKFTAVEQQRIIQNLPENKPSTSKGYNILHEHNYNKAQDDTDDTSDAVLVIGRPGEDFHEHPSCAQQKNVTAVTEKDAAIQVTPSSTREADQETNINPEFNPPLSNNENEPGTGESRRNEKTEVDNRNPYAEGIPDLNDEEDQESTFQNLRGSKSAQDPVFSWEKKVEVVPADDGDAVVCLENKGTQEDLPPEISLYCDDDFSPDNEDSDKVPEYQCNECREVITGFRYTCVQCADWDLCAACEARGAHDAHYVLRVPGQRPYSEIQAVLAAIRQQILSENLFLNPVDDSLKMEVKSEHGEDPPAAESGPPPDLDSLPDLELLPDLDPLPVPDPIGEQRPDSENSFTDSSEESVSDAGSPSRTETPDQPFTHTEYLESSSDDSDASHSPLRKRNRTTPIETHENVAPKPAIVQDNPGLAGYTIKPRDTIALTCRQLKKVHPSQIPRQILANVSATSKPRANLAHSVSRANPTRFNQGVMRTRPNPAPLLIPQHQVIIEEPVESIAHQQASTFVPSILKRGRPRTLELEDPAIHRTDHEREIIVESEPTLRPEDFSAPIQDLRLEGNSERIQDSYLEENAEQLNEPSEFCLRLPPGTDEESLIQALQCPVTVRLKRDF